MKKRVMLLIDADNVSADVIEQSVQKVMAEHGAIHVRRAYCTAETAVSHQKLFKANSIRPIVNLSTGKNSTDIALAVDAVDLVCVEHPDVVVIVSSDSDFAPLVIKLREKGCRVEGIGQLGKTGDDSKPVYDAFIDIAHRKANGQPVVPARKRASSRSKPVSPAPAPAPAPVPEPAAAPRASHGRGRTKAAEAPAPAAPAPAAKKAAMPDDLRRILAVLPELVRGQQMELGVAAERLREEELLAKRATPTSLFKKYPDWFVLLPDDKRPNKVEYRRTF